MPALDACDSLERHGILPWVFQTLHYDWMVFEDWRSRLVISRSCAGCVIVTQLPCCSTTSQVD